MIQRAKNSRFALETRQSFRVGRQPRRQGLDRDVAWRFN
jgi:hypothetical protein